jgi:hypothetical protein
LILLIAEGSTPYISASTACLTPVASLARISKTCPVVSLCRPHSSPRVTLSTRVTHSRLSGVLLVRTLSLWLTSGRLSGLGTNASATSTCTSVFRDFPKAKQLAVMYPPVPEDSRLIPPRTRWVPPPFAAGRNRGRLFNLPQLDISYAPSNPTTGRHSSIICPPERTCSRTLLPPELQPCGRPTLRCRPLNGTLYPNGPSHPRHDHRLKSARPRGSY